MRLINIVDSVAKVNYGVWHAAIVNALGLLQSGIKTELWYPASEISDIEGVDLVALPSQSLSILKKLIVERDLKSGEDIIITHGSWRYPTRWGHYLSTNGFKWIYVPQGMLEPWSFQQKRIKKLLYFFFIEKRLTAKADLIRAVSLPERENLIQFFDKSKVRFLPNGVNVRGIGIKKTSTDKIRYLFLSRLHPKKNIVALVHAWVDSGLNNNDKYELLIAGPDQGEFEKVQSFVKGSGNMKYIGSVYGEEKDKLLERCHFYVLPSFSEGLPSSLLEAMAAGLIPIVTEGCNLPEVFEYNLGYKISTDRQSITQSLEDTSLLSEKMIDMASNKCQVFISDFFSLESITKSQVAIFKMILSKSNS